MKIFPGESLFVEVTTVGGCCCCCDGDGGGNVALELLKLLTLELLLAAADPYSGATPLAVAGASAAGDGSFSAEPDFADADCDGPFVSDCCASW